MRRYVGILGLLLALSLPVAVSARPLCAKRSCRGKLLRSAYNCFATAGACTREPPIPLGPPGLGQTRRVCWANGAWYEETYLGDGYEWRYFAPDGTLCLSETLRGAGRTCTYGTIAASGSEWHTTVGFSCETTLTCPSGRVLRRRRARLRCSAVGFNTDEVCTAGACPEH